jgi:hypothetical protein
MYRGAYICQAQGSKISRIETVPKSRSMSWLLLDKGTGDLVVLRALAGDESRADHGVGSQTG